MSFALITLNENISLYIDLGLSLALLILLVVIAIKNKVSVRLTLTMIGFVVLVGISTIVVDLPVFRWTCLICLCFIVVFLSVLLTDKEKQIELRHHKRISKKETTLTVNEADELFKNLQLSIENLSATKTGALITIERKDDLSEIIEKSGTPVNAKVTPELIGTIFYKGTPLHDGATIIKGDMITTSAVFYQPTQRPLNGKYGSRHRAAIGISEICDALTIVVSEETGKVSIAYKGDLTSVPVANFTKVLKEFYQRQY